MSASVLYMSMSLDGHIAGLNDEPANPGSDGFMRLHEWYGFASDAGPLIVVGSAAAAYEAGRERAGLGWLRGGGRRPRLGRLLRRPQRRLGRDRRRPLRPAPRRHGRAALAAPSVSDRS